MQAKPIKVGIVGFGLSGAIIQAPLIGSCNEFTLTAFASSKPEAVLAKYPQCKVTETIDELVAMDEIDLVVIANPNHLHYPHAKKALHAGKHVVIEKPFVTNSRDGEDLITIAREAGLVLSVFHNRRWDGDFLTVKDLISRGVLGEVLHFESHFDRYKPTPDQRWKEQANPGNGNLFDLGSHLLDQALVLFGEPENFLADCTTQRHGGAATDYFHIILQYERLRVILHAGTVVARPAPRFQIHGTLGSFIKHGLDPQENKLRSGIKPDDKTWGLEEESAWGQITLAKNDKMATETTATLKGNYPEFYRLLAQSIRQGKPPPVEPKEALKVIKLIEEFNRFSRNL